MSIKLGRPTPACSTCGHSAMDHYYLDDHYRPIGRGRGPCSHILDGLCTCWAYTEKEDNRRYR